MAFHTNGYNVYFNYRSGARFTDGILFPTRAEAMKHARAERRTNRYVQSTEVRELPDKDETHV